MSLRRYFQTVLGSGPHWPKLGAIALCAALCGCGSEAWDDATGDFRLGLAFPAELDARSEPIQVNLQDPPAPFELSGFSIHPVARYDIAARVLSGHSYTRGPESSVSPLDLALGWGPKATDDVVDVLRVRQWGRFYRWEVKSSDIPMLPYPIREMGHFSANVHLIPATDEIRREMMALRRGDPVHLGGYLVNVDLGTGWWRTSLTRTDTGPGACEILFVTRIKKPGSL